MNDFSLSAIREIKLRERDNILRSINGFEERVRPSFAFSPGRGSGIGIIAEIKRSSPRGTMINVDTVRQARSYQEGGASGISVLTEGTFFAGSWRDLLRAGEAISLPLLCKEFIYYREQIDLAYRYGADMVLLIAQALSCEELQTLYDYIIQYSMIPLIEVHHPDELAPVLELFPEYLLVNMRNLNKLSIDLPTGIETLKQIPDGVERICASGIQNRSDIEFISRTTGTSLFLIGTSLMRSSNPAKFLKELLYVC
jgi:indole-3-glycerol phosphate synthase